MSVPWQSARDARGLLLVSGDPARVAAWVRRGLVACHVVPLGGWSAVVPAELASRARPPYDDAVTVLASRPVAARLRPALGFWSLDGRAVATVSPRGLRAGQRWLVWQPGEGPLDTPGLALARPGDLAAAAGRQVSRAEVAAVVSQARGDAGSMLVHLMQVLAVPGADLLDGLPAGSGDPVEPSAKAVGRFESRVAEEARHRAEMEGL
ncbi:hypothetical protein [Nostocoides sp. HKS02]|uniref:hypothetical protein n=1 Tax=Nostocoides sp. HKS02 TaxID=1813880 RepID=UPI0012B4BE8A|nr:hypothetical protein [Tetrasphaera sp. HKS02]QGN57048.1 hypothetical protein GKE56_03110 [Tetrasphaera sp. HKS02]